MFSRNINKSILAVSITLALAGSPLAQADILDTFIPTAAAASDGGGHKGAMGVNRGGQGGKGASGQVKRGGGNKAIADILAEDGDDDSDRPDWAMGNKEENPHRGEGSAGSDIMKGGDYGDIWVILRNDDGTPILDANGNIQPCTDMACTETIQLTEDGELPPEFADDVIPVEFGRLNISRAPNSVLEHSLVEALSKLDGGVLGDTVTLDPSGRLVVDGNTIDSPLENLALYEALLTTTAVDGVITLSITTQAEGVGTVTYSFAVPEDMRLDLAASAIAAASDKTGELTTDEVVNITKFLDADDELATLVTDYTYSSSVYNDVKVWILVETSPGVFEPQLVNITDYVTFNPVPAIDGDNDGIDRFTQAADDAVQVLEFVHDSAIDQ